MGLLEKAIVADIERFFEEDDLQSNAFYLRELPEEVVECQLKIKSDLLLSGLPFFVAAFNFLGAHLSYDDFKKYEGKNFAQGEVIPFQLPFSIALTAERVALNLLQRSSAVSTLTQKFVEKASHSDIAYPSTSRNDSNSI